MASQTAVPLVTEVQLLIQDFLPKQNSIRKKIVFSEKATLKLYAPERYI